MIYPESGKRPKHCREAGFNHKFYRELGKLLTRTGMLEIFYSETVQLFTGTQGFGLNLFMGLG